MEKVYLLELKSILLSYVLSWIISPNAPYVYFSMSLFYVQNSS